MAKSKVAIAKEEQKYEGKPLAKRCRVCANLKIREEQTDHGWVKEFLSCGIGNFKVTANAICERFEVEA